MKYSPINPKFTRMLHGGDYNPEQWKDVPGIWEEDFRLMNLAGCNTMTVGVFSWASLEQSEGVYDFSWLDEIMNRLKENHMYAVLATPSGARPAWLSQRYPEVLRTDDKRQKHLHGGRHNHCFTSPVYREKTRAMNRILAERYGKHPALLVWHISNEFNGECHCELCQEAFRNWLKRRYGGELDRLNKEWWTAFWSHTYTDWSQIESPSGIGEHSLAGLNLDWKRFVTDQTVDFMKNEIAPLRELTPEIPITTNLMGTFPGLNYAKLAKEVDIVSWDNYPEWHNANGDITVGCDTSFVHDLNRSLKGGRPFMIMESTPSMTNWHSVCKLKRPGVHLLSSLQAVAHGSDTVQYFQWRKSRGGFEKYHGAVVDHCGHENTRVFHEVREVGKALEKLDDIVGTSVKPEAAVIYDWENRWAIDEIRGMNNIHKDYERTCRIHYRAFWERGVPVDVIDMDGDFSGYRLIAAPMLYMLRPGVAERIERFVENGGIFVTTYLSGIVNENDLCFQGGFPGPLRKVLGIWNEETDSLYDEDQNDVIWEGNTVNNSEENMLTTGETIKTDNHKAYSVKDMCDLLHCETAVPLAFYQKDFYSGRPALTVNEFGRGRAYYIAFRNHVDFESDFYNKLIEELHLRKALTADLPQGVTAQLRTDGEKEFVFILNFTDQKQRITLPEEKEYKELLTDVAIRGTFLMEGYGVMILQ